MKLSFEDLLDKLNKKNIRLSHQRMKILEYLSNNQFHPSVDQIYNSLRKDSPMLSKTTVYNTLNVLVDANIIREISIEDKEIRYDVIVENHGHFKCQSCGTIYNFNIDIDSASIKDLDDFQISEKDVYFKGVCPGCLEDI